MTIRNARIAGTELGREAHGIFSYMLDLDFGDGAQGYGGYALDHAPETPRGERVGTAFGCEAIMRLLDVLDVPTWERLVGTPVRVRYEDHRPRAIGHFTKEQWLDLQALAQEHRQRDARGEVG